VGADSSLWKIRAGEKGVAGGWVGGKGVQRTGAYLAKKGHCTKVLLVRFRCLRVGSG